MRRALAAIMASGTLAVGPLAVYTVQAVQQTYQVQPYNNSGSSDTYTLVVLFP